MTYHYQTGYPKQPWSIELWRSDERMKASIHFNWNWKGKAHWLCIWLPEWIGL